jgi:hypothetical protein
MFAVARRTGDNARFQKKLAIRSARKMAIPKIYFYCSNEPGNLQEDVIALAEGLTDLGIRYYSNCDYWLQSATSGDYLFRHEPGISHHVCDIVVVGYTWPYWVKMKNFSLRRQPLPDGLFKKGRTYTTVYMDNFDGHRTISWEREYRQFDVILRSKLNSRIWYPENMRPWAYGLTNRFIQATANPPPFASRRRTLLVNFGASHPYPHGARNLARTCFEPKIERILPLDRTLDDLSEEPSDPYEALMWHQTGGRFSRSYYERLKISQAVECFCGELIPPMPFRDPERYLVGGNRAKLRRMLFQALGWFDPRPPRSVGWDSFRFWEALAAGCAAINVDLGHYGVELPVMPENGKHYLGINFSRIDDFVERLRAEPTLLESVGRAGKRWAVKHYSPKAVAQRFLSLFGYDRRS